MMPEAWKLLFVIAALAMGFAFGSLATTAHEKGMRFYSLFGSAMMVVCTLAACFIAYQVVRELR